MPVPTVPQPLQSQIAAGQAQASEMLRRLLAGESVLPAGWIPTGDTLRSLYGLALQAQREAEGQLDLSKFYQTYVFPYLASPGEGVRQAAWDFLSQALLERPDQTALNALLSSLRSYGTATSLGAAAETLQRLAPRYYSESPYQQAFQRFVSGLSSNLAGLPPPLWETVANLWATAQEYAPAIARQIQPRLPQDLTSYTFPQRLTLQQIAQLLAGAESGWIGPQGFVPSLEALIARSRQGTTELAGIGGLAPGGTGLSTVKPEEVLPTLTLQKALSEVKLENKAAGAGQRASTTGGQIARVKTRSGWKMINVDQATEDLKKLAGLFFNAAEFDRYLVQHGSELSEIIGPERLARLRAWARARREWPSPPEGQTRWGGIGRDPIELYLANL